MSPVRARSRARRSRTRRRCASPPPWIGSASRSGFATPARTRERITGTPSSPASTPIRASAASATTTTSSRRRSRTSPAFRSSARPTSSTGPRSATCSTGRAARPAATPARTRRGCYAPTLRHHDGRFWMITTVCTLDGGLQNFFVTADDPAGPWSEPVAIGRVRHRPRPRLGRRRQLLGAHSRSV